MKAETEACCSDCGSTYLLCGECGPGHAPEEVECASAAILDPRVRDHIMRTKCRCEMDPYGSHWLLCGFHEGYAAAVEDLR